MDVRSTTKYAQYQGCEKKEKEKKEKNSVGKMQPIELR